MTIRKSGVACYDHAMQGMITEVQRFSIHDGPGIRTTAFLKGCPLHCPWCHNPETINSQPEVLFYPELCIGCGRCIEVCPDHHRREGDLVVHDHADCDACAVAAHECPTGALRLTGTHREAEDLASELLRDRVFFEESGGGVTISGGEPLAQAAFTRDVLAHVKEAGIHTCVDTSLSGGYESIRSLIEVTDLFLVDCKETDSLRHASLTGASMDKVRENLDRLGADGRTAWLRCPMVPGEHDRLDHLEAVGALAERSECVEEVWLLPFHPTATHKWRALGRTYRYDSLSVPAPELVEEWARLVRSMTSKPVRFSGASEQVTARSER